MAKWEKDVRNSWQVGGKWYNKEKHDLASSFDSKFDFSKYNIKEDIEAVDEVKEYIKNELGISSVEFTELKNADVVKPIAEKMNSMAKEYRKLFTSIRVIDMGDEITIAETRGDTLVLNSKFMNSKDATLEILKQWEKTNYIPKDCNSIEYVGSHEYYHLLTQYLIDEPQSEVVIRITRALKNGCGYVSTNSKNNIHEFV